MFMWLQIYRRLICLPPNPRVSLSVRPSNLLASSSSSLNASFYLYTNRPFPNHLTHLSSLSLSLSLSSNRFLSFTSAIRTPPDGHSRGNPQRPAFPWPRHHSRLRHRHTLQLRLPRGLPRLLLPYYQQRTHDRP